MPGLDALFAAPAVGTALLLSPPRAHDLRPFLAEHEVQKREPRALIADATTLAS